MPDSAEHTEMQAGRELDVLICERVMGLCPHIETRRYYIEDGNSVDSGFDCVQCGCDIYGIRLAAYSTDIAAAWEVVAEMDARGISLALHNNSIDGWTAHFYGDGYAPEGRATADTAPLAICRAALRLFDHLNSAKG